MGMGRIQTIDIVGNDHLVRMGENKDLKVRRRDLFGGHDHLVRLRSYKVPLFLGNHPFSKAPPAGAQKPKQEVG